MHVLPVCHHSGPNSKVHQLCISSPLHLFILTCSHKPPASLYGGIVGILCSVICWQSDLRRIWSTKPPFETQEASHLPLIIRSFQALCLRLCCSNFICQQREVISQVDRYAWKRCTHTSFIRNINQSVHTSKNWRRTRALNVRRPRISDAYYVLQLAPWLGWCFLSRTCWEQQRQRTKKRQTRMRKKFQMLAWNGIVSRVPSWRAVTEKIQMEIPLSAAKVRASGASEARAHFYFYELRPNA